MEHAPSLPRIPCDIIDYYLETGLVTISLIAEVIKDRFLQHRLRVSFLKTYIVLSNAYVLSIKLSSHCEALTH